LTKTGTLIFTGTPAGVGFGRKPQISMSAGDITKVEIDGIGIISNKIVYEE
jgi:2-keto-4-pentenoate hydratase/2-oxohepta-3-ene-1,7-dioic acid hydratase in catechol pathway